jgi:hypothetical protein
LWKGSPWLTILRDVVCLVLGAWGVVNEELSAHPDLSRLGFFGILMIAPMTLAGWWLGRTGSQSSPPEPAPSPVPPSSR